LRGMRTCLDRHQLTAATCVPPRPAVPQLKIALSLPLPQFWRKCLCNISRRQVLVTGVPVRHIARLLGLATATAALLSFISVANSAPASGGIPKLQRDGTIKMGGRNLR